jgi:hypothetical protein
MILLFTLAIASPRVGYTAGEAPSPWQPIEPEDVSATVEHAALEVLSKSGSFVFDKLRPPQPAKEDYELRISGQMIDDTESHTVYLSFEPRGDSPLGSFRAADTVVIGKLPRAVMMQKIEASTRAAAAQLNGALSAALGRAGNADPALDTSALPFKWPEMHVAASGVHSEDLHSPDYQKRMAALRELTSQALASPAPRQTLEQCALTHKDKEMRLGCLRALKPLSRKVASTERVVIEVFRKDPESDIVNEASEQMLYFTGLARGDAIQAWLESAGKGRVVGPLQELGDVANIDLVIAHCLLAAGQKPKYQRSKSACLALMKPLPQPRKRAILWRLLKETDAESPLYLEGAGEREGSMGTDWQTAVNLVLDGARRFEPGLEALLWQRYERALSSAALDVLADEAPATPSLVDHLLEAMQGAQARRALQGLKRITKEAPQFKAQVRDKVAELQATSGYHKSVSSRDLEQFLRETKS